MKVEPYLTLSGRCEEALAFYNQAIGANTTMLMRFDESPDKKYWMPLPTDWGQKVMHSSMTVGDTTVMLSDGMSTEPVSFAGVTLSITANDEAHAKRCLTLYQSAAKYSCRSAKHSGRRASE